MSRSTHLRDGALIDCLDETQQDDAPVLAINFIKRSKRLVILGAPGAGKTTLVQFLAAEVAAGG